MRFLLFMFLPLVMLLQSCMNDGYDLPRMNDELFIDFGIIEPLNISAGVSCYLNKNCLYVINFHNKEYYKSTYCNGIISKESKCNVAEIRDMPDNNIIHFSIMDRYYKTKVVEIDLNDFFKSIHVTSDSVYVNIPEGGSAKIFQGQDTTQYQEFFADSLENASFSFSKKDGFRDFIKIISSYTNKTAYATEIVRIYANMYWKQPIQGDSI